MLVDGFESGSLAAWTGKSEATGCSVSTETNNPHHGTYNMKSYVPSGTVSDASSVAYKDLGTTYETLYMRVYVKFDALPEDANDYHPFLGFWQGATSNNMARAGVHYNGSIHRWFIRGVSSGTTFTNYYGTSTPQVNSWYCLELQAVRGDGTGAYRLYVNGTLEVEATGLSNTARTMRYARVGFDSGIPPDLSNLNIYVDCVVVSDAYIGPDLEVNDLAVGNILTMKAQDDKNYIDIRAASVQDSAYPDAYNPILHISQGIFGMKDLSVLGFVGAVSPARILFNPAMYTACADSDIGKEVKDDGVRVGTLAKFDNAPQPPYPSWNPNGYPVWWISSDYGDTITSGSIMTITQGTGAGTTNSSSVYLGGGAILIGHGFYSESDQPSIRLTDAEAGFDTLNILRSNKNPPYTSYAKLACDDISCADITPQANNTYNLGASDKAWHDIFSAYAHIGELTVTQDIYTDVLYGLTNNDLLIQPYSGKKVHVNGILRAETYENLPSLPPAAHASTHEYGGSDQVRNLDYLDIRGVNVISTARDGIFNSVKGTYSGAAVKAGDYLTLSWDDTYSYITAHNRHMKLNTDEGKDVVVARNLHVGSSIITNDSIGAGGISPSGKGFFALASQQSDWTAFYSLVDSEGYPRFFIRVDGAMFWGSGASACDTILYRDSADVLKTDDSFIVGGLLRTINPVFADLTDATRLIYIGKLGWWWRIGIKQGSDLSLRIAADDNLDSIIAKFDTNCRLYLPQANTSGGIQFGDDIILYRQTSPSPCLELNSSMIIDGALQVGSGLSVTGNVGATGDITAGGGNMYVGSKRLYQDGTYLRSGSSFVTDYRLVVGNFANTTYAGPLYRSYYNEIGYNTSTLRDKENLEEITDCSWIYNLRPVIFDWKDKERQKIEGRGIGLIAEEVNKIAPHLVWLDQEGLPEGVHYEWLAVPMIVELKKLRLEVESLREELSALKGVKVVA